MTRWAWVWVSDDVHDGHTHTHSHHQYLSWRHTPAWCLLLHFFPLWWTWKHRLTRWKLWPTISPKMLNIAFLFAEVTLHMFGAFVNDLYVRCLNNSMHMLGLVCLSVLSVPLVWSLFVLLHFLSVSLVFCLFSVSSTCLFIPPPPPPFVWPNFFFFFSFPSLFPSTHVHAHVHAHSYICIAQAGLKKSCCCSVPTVKIFSTRETDQTVQTDQTFEGTFKELPGSVWLVYQDRV